MRSSLSAMLLVVMGCASGTPVNNQTVVWGGGFENVQGEARLVVRTFIAEDEDTRREVLGAQCRVESSLYSAVFTSPNRLVVPNFGPQSPELSVACSAADLAGGGQVRILTRWRYPPNYQPGAFGYPFPGRVGPPIWGATGGWAWGGSAFPVSEYPDINILLQ